MRDRQNQPGGLILVVILAALSTALLAMARGSEPPHPATGSRGLTIEDSAGPARRPLRQAPAAKAARNVRPAEGKRPAPAEFRVRRMRVTAYCPCPKCCGRWADGVTTSGRPVTANGGRFVAADKALPLGTLLVVPGYADGKPVPVLDRGGAIRGRRLDVFFPTHQQARRWGVRWLDVAILSQQG